MLFRSTLWYDSRGVPEVRQAYKHDKRIVLKYVLNPQKINADSVKFPEDFLLEVPRQFVTLNPKKHLDQVTLLGSHNCYTNKDEGYLYYQQGESTYKQYVLSGVRMLRPAWHNPSGSPIDSPNKEAILCHADDHLCKTVSLATRGFKPHELVKTELRMLADILHKEKQTDILVININNYLTPQKTDEEIMKVPELIPLILTPDDVYNQENQKLWQGFWPTIEWMEIGRAHV